MMRKLGLICLALLVVLATLGVSYARWSQNLVVSSTSLGTAPPPVIGVPLVDNGSVTDTAASVSTDLTSLGTGSSAAMSVQYSTSSDFSAFSEGSPTNMTGTGAFNADLTNLTPGQTYYFRVKTEGLFTVYSPPESFVTQTNLQITTASLPDGRVGVSYSQPITYTGGTAPYTLDISNGSLPGGLAISGTTITGIPTAIGTSNFTIRIQDNSSPSHQIATRALSVYIGNNLVITQNPSDQTVIYGNDATFTAAATGIPAPTVQWQISTNGGASFSNITGATATTLTISKPKVPTTGNQYRAVFTNAGGSATTSAATLTVNKKNLTVSGITADDKGYDGTTSVTVHGLTSTADSTAEMQPTGTANVTSVGTVTYAYDASNTTYALWNATGDTADFTYFNIPVAANAAINTVTVTMTGYRSSPQQLTVAVSTDGTNFSAAQTTSFTGSASSQSFTGATGLWGLAWLPTNFSSNNFKVRVGATSSSGNAYLGNLTVRVNYTTPPTATLNGILTGDTVTLDGSAAVAAFAGKNAGSGKTVNVTGLTLGGADAADYSVTATTTANITTRSLTVSATGIDKVYDGSATATVTLTDNRVFGDTLTAAYASALFNNKNVGNGKPVNVSGISISGPDAVNYALTGTTASANASITPKALTLSGITAGDKTYDGTTSATISGLSQVSNPVNVGQNNSTTASTSLSVNVPAGGVAAGNTLIIALAMDPASGTVSATDSKGNNYTVDGDVTNNTHVRTVVLSAPVTTALTSGNTITVTFPSTTSKAISILAVNGLVSASATDQNHTGTGNGAGPSSGATASTVQANELLMGAIGSESYSTTFAAGTSYSALTGAIANRGNNQSNSISVFPEYRIVSAVGAYAADGTLSNSRQWAAAIVTYKAFTGAAGLVGIIAGDTVSLGNYGSSAAFADKNVGTGKTVNISGLSISGTDAANYTLNATLTANITAVSSMTTLGLSAGSISLGNSVTATATVTGELSGESLSGTVDFQVSNDGIAFNKFGASKPLSGGAATSDAYSPPAIGTYYIRAIYSSTNANYNGSQSGNTDDPLNVTHAVFGLDAIGSTNYPEVNVGNLDTSGTLNAAQSDILTGIQYTTTVPLTAIQIVTYGTVSGNIKVAIYSDVGGYPGARLFSEVQASTTGNTWSVTTIPNIYLAPGTYWLLANSNATGVVSRQDAAANAIYRSLTFSTAFNASYSGSSGWTLAPTYKRCSYIVGVPMMGYAKATIATLSDPSGMTSLKFYSHAAGNVRLAIYSGSSAPAALLWQSGSVACVAGSWNTININMGTPTSLNLSPGTYWLAWQWNSVNSGPSFLPGDSGEGNYIVMAFGSFPATWTGGTSSSETWSLYVTY